MLPARGVGVQGCADSPSKSTNFHTCRGVLAEGMPHFVPGMIAEALLDLLSIRRNHQVRILGPSAESDVEGVHDMVSGLTQGVGPRAKDAASYSGFFSVVLKRLENFYSKDVVLADTAEASRKQSPSKAKTMYGLPAIRAHFAEIARMFELDEGISVTMSQLQPLKTYSWLLDEEQSQRVRSWIGVVASRFSTTSSLGQIADSSGDLSVVPAAQGAPAAASSSSSSGQTQRAKVQEARVVESQANMLRFFVGPKGQRTS